MRSVAISCPVGLVLLAAALATATTSTAGELPGPETIERKVRAGLSQIAWAGDAEVQVVRGHGGGLSRWVVAVACRTCGREAAEVDLIVVGLDRDGAVHCAVPEGVHVCSEPVTGGMTSQSFTFRLDDGRTVAVEEQFHSAGAKGGRVFSVAVRSAASDDRSGN